MLAKVTANKRQINLASTACEQQAKTRNIALEWEKWLAGIEAETLGLRILS